MAGGCWPVNHEWPGTVTTRLSSLRVRLSASTPASNTRAAAISAAPVEPTPSGQSYDAGPSSQWSPSARFASGQVMRLSPAPFAMVARPSVWIIVLLLRWVRDCTGRGPRGAPAATSRGRAETGFDERLGRAAVEALELPDDAGVDELLEAVHQLLLALQLAVLERDDEVDVGHVLSSV